MKILIFGASGMLGHRLMLQLSKYHEVYGTVRSENFILPSIDADHIIPMIHCGNWNVATSAIVMNEPDVVINCTAAIPQRGDDIHQMINSNAQFPHLLSEVCKHTNARLIHFSTDAVFSGKRGNYTEDDDPDGNDTYALTKRLGEISDQPHVLTLRCCPIGRELNGAHSLVEWFLAQTGEVRGYTGAWFSPLTTHEIARLLNDYILPHPDLHGLYHVGGALAINKYVLLEHVRDRLGLDTAIIPTPSAKIDRTLNSQRLFQQTGYQAPAIWEKMLDTMLADNALYEGVHA